MKKKFLLFLITIFSLSLFAQNTANDIIYPADQSKPITNCKINKIEDGNTIIYTQEGIEKSMEAAAVKRNGEHIDLSEFVSISNVSVPDNPKPVVQVKTDNTFRVQDYNYYHEEQMKAQKTKGTGMFLTSLGLGVSIFGYSIFKRNYYTETADWNTSTWLGTIMFIGGAVLMDVGIPLWISGGIKNANNQKAMDKCLKSKTSLNFGTTNDGVGLTLRF